MPEAAYTSVLPNHTALAYISHAKKFVNTVILKTGNRLRHKKRRLDMYTISVYNAVQINALYSVQYVCIQLIRHCNLNCLLN